MPSCVEINRRVDGVKFCFRTATRHLQPGDDIPHRVVVVIARRPRDGRAHAVLVVLDAKNHGQFPQSSHVHGLPDLALVRCAVAVAPDRDGHRLAERRLVLVREGQTGTDGHLRADDALPAEEVFLFVVKCMEPPMPPVWPCDRPINSARTPSTLPPRASAMQWHLYEVIHESSGDRAAWMPVPTAS